MHCAHSFSSVAFEKKSSFIRKMYFDTMRPYAKACAFLRARVDRARHDGRLRLPTVIEFARQAGVSHETMRKAVLAYADAGIVSAKSRRGIIVDPRCGPPPDIAESAHISRGFELSCLPWQRTAQRLRTEILQGTFGYGQPLPSRKELQARYGISYPTLQKALNVCLREQCVLRHRKKLVTFGGRKNTSRSRIILIGEQRGKGIALGLEGLTFLRALEHACAGAGLAIETCACQWNEHGFVLRDITTGRDAQIRDPAMALGYVFIAVFAGQSEAQALGMTAQDIGMQEKCNRITLALRQHRRPIALYTFEPHLQLPPTEHRESPLRMFRMAGTERPALTVGRYLLSKGHAKIAFISPFHQARWSRERLEALLHCYREGGYGQGVRAVTLEQHYSRISFTDDAARRYDLSAVRRAWERWKSANPNLAGGFGFMDDGMRAMEQDAVLNAEIALQLEPLLDSTLQQSEITAWVAANDATMRFALAYLQSRHVRIGQDLSLVSFDNTEPTLRDGICSFDFNISTAANMIVQYLIDPRPLTAPAGGGIVDIEGVMIPRMSVGPVR
ncbi:MAG: GntR family transcriptional regulator [Chitinivibrionales bacterium]|nr:GntR family transcriptional regulator [Chitinivibrionales bacterium]